MKDQRKKVIFDTDIGGDCDDAGALAMLHSLCDLGEAELLAVTACYSSKYVAGCIDAINTYYERTVPVGINYESPMMGDGFYARILCEEFPNHYPPDKFGISNGTRDTLEVLRHTLAMAEDNSVVLVVTGQMSSLARLVKSEADEICSLTGIQLIQRKIQRTVVMAGRFKGTWPMRSKSWGDDERENNIIVDIPAAQIVCEMWPGELVFSSFEIGGWCISMKEFVTKSSPQNPVRYAYEVFERGPDGKKGRESWDHTAMLEAVRPGRYWYYHPWGKISVDDSGITTWRQEENGKQTYLITKVDYENVREVIDELVMRKR